MNEYFPPRREREALPPPPPPKVKVKTYCTDCVYKKAKKFDLSEDELGRLKADLLYFVKRVSHSGREAPEEAYVLPDIVKLLFDTSCS